MNTMLAGGSHISHTDVLRAGSTEEVVVPHQVMAPLDGWHILAGVHLWSCPPTRSRQRPVVAAGLGVGTTPDSGVVDVDSTICQVHGRSKQGASFGYTKCRCYHPLLATLADTGEIVHGRLRQGSANTQRGTKRFVDETVARFGRDDPSRSLTMRFDSGFWNNQTMTELKRLGVRFTMAAKTGNPAIARAIATIDNDAWIPIDYTCDGDAEVADCTYTTGKGRKAVTRRLVVRRTMLADC